MAIREGRWDCQYCGSSRILGRDKLCPGCGRPRPEGTTFYLSDDAPIITDGTLLEQAKAGADWLCEYCGASNAASAEKCQQCDAQRGEARQQEVKEFKAGAVPQAGDQARDLPPMAASLAAGPSSSVPAAPPAWRKAWPLLLGVVALLCVCSFLFFQTSESRATVTGLSWEREIEVEALEWVEEEDWSLPSEAELISEEEAIYRTEQEKVGERTYVCGQRDLGNGFFEDVECTEPIYEDKAEYRTRYTYRIRKWQVTRTEEAGGQDQSPRWPALSLGRNEREGERNERYEVHFETEEGQRHTVSVAESRWRDFAVGQRYLLEINGLGQAEVVRQLR